MINISFPIQGTDRRAVPAPLGARWGQSQSFDSGRLAAPETLWMNQPRRLAIATPPFSDLQPTARCHFVPPAGPVPPDAVFAPSHLTSMIRSLPGSPSDGLRQVLRCEGRVNAGQLRTDNQRAVGRSAVHVDLPHVVARDKAACASRTRPSGGPPCPSLRLRGLQGPCR